MTVDHSTQTDTLHVPLGRMWPQMLSVDATPSCKGSGKTMSHARVATPHPPSHRFGVKQDDKGPVTRVSNVCHTYLGGE